MPIDYTWDLGDGTMIAGPSVIHGYQGPGDYLIKLMATNECGTNVITGTLLISDSSWHVYLPLVRRGQQAQRLYR